MSGPGPENDTIVSDYPRGLWNEALDTSPSDVNRRKLLSGFMSLHPESDLTGPADPEHDPTASYALEPDVVKALTDRIVSTTGQAVPSFTPITGQPLASVPQSSSDDVASFLKLLS